MRACKEHELLALSDQTGSRRRCRVLAETRQELPVLWRFCGTRFQSARSLSSRLAGATTANRGARNPPSWLICNEARSLQAWPTSLQHAPRTSPRTEGSRKSWRAQRLRDGLLQRIASSNFRHDRRRGRWAGIRCSARRLMTNWVTSARRSTSRSFRKSRPSWTAALRAL